MLASFSPVEGSLVSKYSPSVGWCQAPSMKCANLRLWRSSQASASFGSSSAGPYSMEANFSAIFAMTILVEPADGFLRSANSYARTLDESNLGDWVSVICRVTACRVVVELAFNVGQHAAGAKTKQVRVEPAIPEFFFDQRQPVQRLLSRANSPGRLESDNHARALGVLADGAHHYQANRQ